LNISTNHFERIPFTAAYTPNGQKTFTDAALNFVYPIPRVKTRCYWYSTTFGVVICSGSWNNPENYREQGNDLDFLCEIL